MTKFWILCLCISQLFCEAFGSGKTVATVATTGAGSSAVTLPATQYFGDLETPHFDEAFLNCPVLDFTYKDITTTDITLWATAQVSRLGKFAPTRASGWAIERNVAIAGVKFFYQHPAGALQETKIVHVPFLFFDSHTYYDAKKQRSVMNTYPPALIAAPGTLALEPTFFTAEFAWRGGQVVVDHPLSFAQKTTGFIDFFVRQFPSLKKDDLSDRLIKVNALLTANPIPGDFAKITLGTVMHAEIAIIEHLRTNLYWYMPRETIGTRIVGATILIATTRDPCRNCAFYLRELSKNAQPWLWDETERTHPPIVPIIAVVGTKEHVGSRSSSLNCPASPLDLTRTKYKYIITKQ